MFYSVKYSISSSSPIMSQCVQHVCQKSPITIFRCLSLDSTRWATHFSISKQNSTFNHLLQSSCKYYNTKTSLCQCPAKTDALLDTGQVWKVDKKAISAFLGMNTRVFFFCHCLVEESVMSQRAKCFAYVLREPYFVCVYVGGPFCY